MMKKVPKRRFKGFLNAGDWEQRKLGELGKTFNGLTGKTKKDFGHGDAQYITYLNVFQNTISDLSMTERIEIDKSQNTVQYGDILFTTSSETPEEVGMSSVWLGEKPNTYLNSFCFGYRPTVDIDHQFMGNLLRSPHVRNEMKILAQGISRYNISKNKVMDLEITLPSKEEQKLIGSILNHIDSQLTLHQRKLEKLQATKKALLYELFPIENSRRPKRRFKGFTDDWEQRKLGEIANINPRTELPNSFKYVDLESVIGTNLIGCKKIEKENAPSRAQRLASFGDIFYQTVRPYQRNNYLFEKEDDDVVFSTGYAQLRSELDSYFLFTLVQTDSFVSKVLDHCTGTSYPAINSSELGKILISVPQNKLESHQIGTIFRVLDNLITLHQRKLEKLKNLKAAYLNEMFV